MSQAISILAPDQGAAQDLARGGLLVFRPLVVEHEDGWEVQLSVPTQELEAMSSMVRYWLRRNGLSDVEMHVAGRLVVLRARQGG